MKGPAERLLLLGPVFLALLSCAWPLSAATLHIEARGSLLEIQADAVPLGDVLAALAAKTGLVVHADQPLTEPVNCHLAGLTVEQGVMQLVKNRNYALLFAETRGATTVPPTLWILPSPPPGTLISPHDRTNVYSKDWLVGQVGDPVQLARQFTAVPSGSETEGKGVVITNLAPGSVLQRIGIRQGDLVSRVNGRPTRDAEEFVRALQALPPGDSTIMMIERRKPDGRLDPVYVRLE